MPRVDPTRICALIPARGGSKAIPGKNIKLLADKPLLAHSIAHAQAASSIGRIFVSTDDPEIAEVAQAFGAEVPCLRPAEIADDAALDLPVFEHMLKHLENEAGYFPELIVYLRPTAPLREPSDIDQMVQQLLEHPDATSIRSVSEPRHHPYRMFHLDSESYLNPLLETEFEEPYAQRRQDLPDVYWFNCVIDVTRRATIVEQNSMMGKHMLGYVMDPKYVVDIDTIRDFEIAEEKLKQLDA